MVINGNKRHSVVLSGTQWQSVVISGNQWKLTECTACNAEASCSSQTSTCRSGGDRWQIGGRSVTDWEQVGADLGKFGGDGGRRSWEVSEGHGGAREILRARARSWEIWIWGEIAPARRQRAYPRASAGASAGADCRRPRTCGRSGGGREAVGRRAARRSDRKRAAGNEEAMREIIWQRAQSGGHQEAIRRSSGGHQEAVWRSSPAASASTT